MLLSDVIVLQGMATMLERVGFTEAAALFYARALKLRPRHLGVGSANALLLPAVYLSASDVELWRERFNTEVVT